MRVTVHQEKCVGAGNCVFTASDVFDQRPADGVVTLLTDEPPAGRQEDVRDAARNCPVQAITIEE